MLSAMGYWSYKNLNQRADIAKWESTNSITDVVNYYTSSRDLRNKNLKDLKLILG